MTSTPHFMAHMSAPVLGDPRLPVRFWNKVAVSPTGCWLWTAGLSSGYGCYSAGPRNGPGRGTTHLAHRIAFQVLSGEIPQEFPHLDHLCRVRNCVNPSHLEPVTQAENNRRMNDQLEPVTECIHGHDFTSENTYFRPATPGHRSCRECARVACRRYRRRRSGASS